MEHSITVSSGSKGAHFGLKDHAGLELTDGNIVHAILQARHLQGVPKKRTFRMLLELSRAASGKVTLSRNLAKVTLPEAALLSSNSILKVRFFWDTLYNH